MCILHMIQAWITVHSCARVVIYHPKRKWECKILLFLPISAIVMLQLGWSWIYSNSSFCQLISYFHRIVRQAEHIPLPVLTFVIFSILQPHIMHLPLHPLRQMKWNDRCFYSHERNIKRTPQKFCFSVKQTGVLRWKQKIWSKWSDSCFRFLTSHTTNLWVVRICSFSVE